MILNLGPIGLVGAETRFDEFIGDWNIPSSILVAREIINWFDWFNSNPCILNGKFLPFFSLNVWLQSESEGVE